MGIHKNLRRTIEGLPERTVRPEPVEGQSLTFPNAAVIMPNGSQMVLVFKITKVKQ